MKKNRPLKILISIILFYTILGFFIIPYVVKNQLIKNLDENLITKTSIEKVFFNPYTLKFEIDNLALSENGKKLIAFEKLDIDFSLLKSIHESHISFKSANLVKPFVDVVLNEDGVINLTTLLKVKETKEETPAQTSQEESKIIDFKITKTQIIGGEFLFTKVFKGKETTLSINNFDYTFYELGTFKNSLASHSLTTMLNKDTKLSMKGGMRLVPFNIYGEVKLDNLKPNEYTGFSDDLLNFKLKNPTLNLNFGYKVNTKNELLVNIDNANLNINDLDLIKDEKTLISLKSFNIANINLDLKEQNLNIEDITLNKFYSDISLNKKGDLNLLSLVNLPKSKDNESKDEKSKDDIKTEESSSKPWNVNLENFALNNSAVDFKDDSSKTSVATDNININLKNLNLVDTKVTADSFSISKVNSNIKSSANVKLNNISLNLDNIKYDKNIVNVISTNLTTNSIQISDSNKNDISVKNLNLKINNLTKDDKNLKVSSVNLTKPIASIVLKPSSNSKEAEKVETKKESKSDTNSLNLDIGPIKINDAKLKFEDRGLPLAFKTNITQLNGSLSELNTKSSKPTTLKVDGKIDKYGYTRITGQVDLNDIKILTDVNMIFKNIAINSFTPYSGKFVGRELADGKLNLNLKYNIKKSNLNAQNSIVISNIKLGKEIESKDAMSLPLELAIALLEDKDGVIDLDIPISGDLNDPQFSIAPIVWKAFTNLIVKAVTAPFSFLASLLGIEADEINSVEFVYGESAILPSEKESLDKIAKIFSKRPNIAIKFASAYDKNLDYKALQNQKLEKVINEDIKKISKAEDKYLKALENRYLTLKDVTPLKELVEKNTTKKDGKTIFDKDSYLETIKAKVKDSIKVETIELENLAKKRATAVLNYLDKTHGIEKNRVFIEKDIKVLDEKDAKFTKFDLEIDLKKK